MTADQRLAMISEKMTSYWWAERYPRSFHNNWAILAVSWVEFESSLIVHHLNHIRELNLIMLATYHVHDGKREATVWSLSVCLIFLSNPNAVTTPLPWQLHFSVVHGLTPLLRRISVRSETTAGAKTIRVIHARAGDATSVRFFPSLREPTHLFL